MKQERGRDKEKFGKLALSEISEEEKEPSIKQQPNQYSTDAKAKSEFMMMTPGGLPGQTPGAPKNSEFLQSPAYNETMNSFCKWFLDIDNEVIEDGKNPPNVLTLLIIN